jgi:putative transposase
MDNFRYRTRYFTDSGVIGSKQFVKDKYQLFKEYFDTKKEKVPVPIKGLEGLFSLKRLASNIL